MWIPSRVKYRKSRKGRVTLNKKQSVIGNSLSSSRIKIIASEPGFLQPPQLESYRKIITTNTKRFARTWANVFPDLPRTAKPKESRMGHGKGGFSYWVTRVSAGAIVCENAGLRPIKFRWLRVARRKFPIKTIVVHKYGGL